MSRYLVYQIDHFDPKIVGQKMRSKVISTVVIASFCLFIFVVISILLKISMDIIFLIYFPLLAIFLICRLWPMVSKMKKFKTIGEIEFTRTSIKKSIGDSKIEYEFHTIKKFELQKHIPLVGISGSLSDNFTYILKIIFINSDSESLVVSNSPVDKRLNINIVETLKTLRKIIEPEITIET